MKSDLTEYAKNVLGIELTTYQKELLKALADGWSEGKQVVHIEFKGRAAGKTTAMRTLGKFLKKSLEEK